MKATPQVPSPVKKSRAKSEFSNSIKNPKHSQNPGLLEVQQSNNPTFISEYYSPIYHVFTNMKHEKQKSEKEIFSQSSLSRSQEIKQESNQENFKLPRSCSDSHETLTKTWIQRSCGRTWSASRKGEASKRRGRGGREKRQIHGDSLPKLRSGTELSADPGNDL